MSQVSRRFLKPYISEKINQLILESVQSCVTTHHVSDFLNDLLTPTEKIMMSKRLAVAFLLLKGYPYDVIQSTLKVSTATIGTMSRMLKIQGNGLRTVLESFQKKEKLRNFFRDLGEAALDILESGKGGNWSNVQRRKRQRKLRQYNPL